MKATKISPHFNTFNPLIYFHHFYSLSLFLPAKLYQLHFLFEFILSSYVSSSFISYPFYSFLHTSSFLPHPSYLILPISSFIDGPQGIPRKQAQTKTGSVVWVNHNAFHSLERRSVIQDTHRASLMSTEGEATFGKCDFLLSAHLGLDFDGGWNAELDFQILVVYVFCLR